MSAIVLQTVSISIGCVVGYRATTSLVSVVSQSIQNCDTIALTEKLKKLRFVFVSVTFQGVIIRMVCVTVPSVRMFGNEQRN